MRGRLYLTRVPKLAQAEGWVGEVTSAPAGCLILLTSAGILFSRRAYSKAGVDAPLLFRHIIPRLLALLPQALPQDLSNLAWYDGSWRSAHPVLTGGLCGRQGVCKARSEAR